MHRYAVRELYQAVKRIEHRLSYTVQALFSDAYVRELGHIRAKIGGGLGADIVDNNMHIIRLLANNAAVRFEDADVVESVITAPAALCGGTYNAELVLRRNKHSGGVTLLVNVADTNNPDDAWTRLEGALDE